MLEWCSRVFWNERVWLPPNTTWQDVAPSPDKAVTYTDYTDLWYPIPFALVFIGLRYLLEKYVYRPLGMFLGVVPRKAPHNPKLEAAYAQLGDFLQTKNINSLAKQTDLTETEIELWWRLRRRQDKHSNLTKFCENLWLCTFYTFISLYGFFVMWDKEWLWDIDKCYIGYPHQGVTDDIWWYYMISTTYYWSAIMSHYFEVRRKDFWQMFFHHIAAVFLLSFSWICNLHRIGTLVLLTHDFGDIFLSATKITKYTIYQKVCDCIFAVFTVIWCITRLWLFPFHIIWSTTFRAPTLIPMFPAYHITNSLLYFLMVLHVMWTVCIMQVIRRAVSAGKIEGDVRSSSSETSDVEETYEKKKEN